MQAKTLTTILKTVSVTLLLIEVGLIMYTLFGKPSPKFKRNTMYASILVSLYVIGTSVYLLYRYNAAHRSSKMKPA
jgi:hypothetical protein